MPDEIYLLVVVKNVDDVFNPVEAIDSFSVIGVFLDKEFADIFAEKTANEREHGDRVVIFGVNRTKELAFSEILVVVQEGVN